MPFALAFCLLRAQVAPLDVKVTLKRTASVAALVKDLSDTSGIPLTVSERRAKEVLIVSMKDVPLDEAMKQIAWATYGVWEKSGSNGYRLMRDSDAERAAEKYYVQWQTREISNGIEILRKQVLEKGLPPEDDKEWIWPQDDKRVGTKATVEDRALALALGDVKPETVVFRSPESWCVYSNQPTPAQHALGAGAREALKLYNATAKTPATTLLLTLDYRFGVGKARMELFAAEGYRVKRLRTIFRPDAKHGPLKPDELADEVPENTPVPLSALSKAWVDAKIGFNVWPSWSDLDRVPNLVKRLQNPDLYEPMETLATDAWVAVGAWKKRNLVANVDDAYLFPYWANNVPDLREAFKMAGGYNAELKPGWIVARPSLVSPPWQHRLDRAAIAKAIRTRTGNSVADLEKWGAFTTATTWAPDPWMVTMYMSYARSSSPSLWDGWNTPRLYGLVPDNLRRAWRDGRPIPLSSLPDSAKYAIRSMILQNQEPPSSLNQQTTVRFPYGVPMEGWLKAEAVTNSAYYFQTPDAQGALTTYIYPENDFREYLQRVQAKNPARFQNFAIKHWSNQVYRLYVEVGEEQYNVAQVESPGPSDAEFTSWANVPASLKQYLLTPPTKSGGG